MAGNGNQLEQTDRFQESALRGQGYDGLLQDSQRERSQVGDRSQKVYNDVPAMTQITGRLPEQAHAVGFRDGKPEPNQPIHHVDNFDRQGNKIGTSDYIYPRAADGSVQMNGYIDRDANGAVKEFAVRLPRLAADKDPVFQKDVFMVYRPRPGQPIDEQQMNETIRLLSNYDLKGQPKSAAQALADQNTYFQTEPLGNNMIRLRDMQVISVALDPDTGRRFTVRAQERSGLPEGQKELTWFEPGKVGQMVRLDRLSQEDNLALLNAKLHGNLRTSIDPNNAADLPAAGVRRRGVEPDYVPEEQMPSNRQRPYMPQSQEYDQQRGYVPPPSSDGMIRRRKG